MSEYAPEYTKRERLLIIAKLSIWAAPLFVVSKLWLMPWFEEYVKTSHCVNYGYFTGTQLVFYFIFVATPIITALALFVVEGPRSI